MCWFCEINCWPLSPKRSCAIQRCHVGESHLRADRKRVLVEVHLYLSSCAEPLPLCQCHRRDWLGPPHTGSPMAANRSKTAAQDSIQPHKTSASLSSFMCFLNWQRMIEIMRIIAYVTEALFSWCRTTSICVCGCIVVIVMSYVYLGEQLEKLEQS